MEVTVEINNAPLLFSPIDVCNALGIQCTANPSMLALKENAGIEWVFPGVDALTDEQQAGLRLFTEYQLTGRERFPGLLQHIVNEGSLQLGKRAYLKESIDNRDQGDPMAAMVYLVSKITVEAENFGRSAPGVAATQTPTIDEVMTYAKQLIDAGEAD